ncbi:uncharacterized protein EI90DRAFT_3284731 [Cantharellus anzutake]|uniref:uncharacterized protein n=1 Tax=Cantharellus anzutake TaxID=1750568 RepID=UPI001906A87B|nr:uncharacterized protein EI90DRAFT_3284731 [Cantharellus anzutake]KAF8342554.1 hypothetical protein EI90DRAFT_3284731 [Cantharellus anzutake]
MSLSELTRNAIVAGVSPEKWEILARQWLDRLRGTSFPQRVFPAFGEDVWIGVRPLLRVFPRDKTLQQYLQIAINCGFLPLRFFVVGLLRWIEEDIIGSQEVPAKEEELALVEALCRMAVSAHYEKNGGVGGILQPNTFVTVSGAAGHHPPRPRRIPEAPLDVSTLMEAAIHAADFCKYSLTLHAAEQTAATASNGETSSSGPFYHTLHTTSPEILSFVLDSIDNKAVSIAPNNLITRLFPLMKGLNNVSALLPPVCVARVMQWTHHLTFLALSSPGDTYMNSLSGNRPGPLVESLQTKGAGTKGQEKATPQPYVSDGLDVKSVMLLRLLVDSMDTIGAGNQPSAIARLLAAYRSMESDAQVFLDNIVLASIRVLAQITQQARGHLDPSNLPEDLVRWRVFTLSRLPALLARLGEVIEVALMDERPQMASNGSGYLSSIKLSLTTLFTEHSDLLNACAYDDHPFKSRSPDLFGEDEEMNEHEGQARERATLAFKADLLLGYQIVSLIDPETVLQVAGRDISNLTGNGKISADADEIGVPIEAYIASKLEADSIFEDSLALIDTAVWDYSSHLILVHQVHQKFASAVASEPVNLESLAFLSRLLHTHRHLMDIIALHQASMLVNLVASALAFASSFSFTNVGDVQTAIGHFGDVVLFIKISFRRFRHSVDQQVAQNWLKAIFDLHSEGIDDELLRTTAPQSLLRLAPSIFVQALTDYVTSASSDRETLRNGASFFHGSLLNWTLPGVLVALTEDTQRQGQSCCLNACRADQHNRCFSRMPRPALLIAGGALLRLLGTELFQSLAQAARLDVVPLENRVRTALGLPFLADSNQTSIRHKSVPYIDAPRLIIREALAHVSMDPLPLNLPILFHYPLNHVLMGLFHELRSTTSEGNEALSPQAVAVSVSILTTPRGSSSVPRSKSPSSVHETLLPYTLKVFLPRLISGITDAETVAPEMDILCAMIGTSVVAQRQYERATRVLTAYSSRLGEDVDVDPTSQDGVSSSVTSFVQWLKEPNASAVRVALFKKLQAIPEYTGHFVVG